jgi:hypothetical protein
MSDGNGSPGVTIDRVQLGLDWVYFEPGQNPPPIEELPIFLNQALLDWLRANPSFAVRATLPIVSGGATVGIHVWYDER